MRSLAFALFLSAAAQALPATVEVAPSVDGPVAIRVPAGGDLQAALDRANSGDVIELASGATFSGNFVLPAKAGNRYVILRTAPTSGLPDAEGRITPAHSDKLAKIQSPNGAPALRTAPGSHHWRLMLLEIGPTTSASGDIVVFGDASATQSSSPGMPHDLVVDRCYIHGDPARGQKRGIAMNGASIVVIGSHISDIKSTSQDAQAIAGWSGTGPFRVENNYLEASGENFMLGGAMPGATGLVPSDLVFRRNHVARPAAWRSENWVVKNLFELKNARRVLVEGNLFENNWVDGQPGYAIVFTPRGEGGAAPWATIEDVTFRYNIVRNSSAGFNLLARDSNGASGTMRRVRIADNLVYAIDRAQWGGNGNFMQIGEGPAEITVEHNTVVHSGNVLTVYGGSREAPSVAERFVFRNNISPHNQFGVIGQSLAVGNQSINAFFPGALFLRNALAGGQAARYPGDNLFPDMDRFSQQFVNYAGRDYRLKGDSEFRRAASDGADLGVNFVTLARTIGARAREWLGLSPSTPQPSAR
jgi:hypothetical protein